MSKSVLEDGASSEKAHEVKRDWKWKYKIHLLSQPTITELTSAQARLDYSPEEGKTLFASLASDA